VDVRTVLCFVSSKEKRKERKKESKRRERLLGLLNARMKRVKGPELHVQRSRSHKLDKERRIFENPLIKGRILREFNVSDRVKKSREDGVDGIFEIAFVELVGTIVTGRQGWDMPIDLIHGHGDLLNVKLEIIDQGKLHN